MGDKHVQKIKTLYILLFIQIKLNSNIYPYIHPIMSNMSYIAYEIVEPKQSYNDIAGVKYVVWDCLGLVAYSLYSTFIPFIPFCCNNILI